MHGLSDIGSTAEEVEVFANILLCCRRSAECIVIEGVAAFLELIA
jgi:hypothetical protein